MSGPSSRPSAGRREVPVSFVPFDGHAGGPMSEMREEAVMNSLEPDEEKRGCEACWIVGFGTPVEDSSRSMEGFLAI